MPPQLLMIFQRQVAGQCGLVLTGAQMLNVGLNRPDEAVLWTGVQLLLTGAANASKALWGVKGNGSAARAARRAPLRESLQVTDASPLKDVAMRNNFEHYDERLFEWWDQSTNHLYLDQAVVDETGVVGYADKDKFRVLDPSTMSLVFWGERFDLQAVATESERVREAAILRLA